jgi:hypothetical protein
MRSPDRVATLTWSPETAMLEHAAQRLGEERNSFDRHLRRRRERLVLT